MPGADIVIVVAVGLVSVLLLAVGVRRILRGSARPKPAAVEAGTTRTSGR